MFKFSAKNAPRTSC